MKEIRVTVSTWNVLAAPYADPEKFPQIRPEYLAWEFRKPMILESLVGEMSDVICLQEATYDLFREADGALAKWGYRGFWSHKGEQKLDGCATFVHQRLPVVQMDVVPFSDGKHVAQVLRVQQGDVPLAFANAHFAFDQPGTSPLQRLGLSQADELLRATSRYFPPTVICGDLNVLPDDEVIAKFAAARYRDFDPEVRPTVSVRGEWQKKDYILVPRSMETVEGGAFVGGLGGALAPNSVHPSDHAMCTARLTYVR